MLSRRAAENKTKIVEEGALPGARSAADELSQLQRHTGRATMLPSVWSRWWRMTLGPPARMLAAILGLAKDSAESVRCEAIAALANLAVNGARNTAPAPRCPVHFLISSASWVCMI